MIHGRSNSPMHGTRVGQWTHADGVAHLVHEHRITIEAPATLRELSALHHADHGYRAIGAEAFEAAVAAGRWHPSMTDGLADGEREHESRVS